MYVYSDLVSDVVTRVCVVHLKIGSHAAAATFFTPFVTPERGN